MSWSTKEGMYRPFSRRLMTIQEDGRLKRILEVMSGQSEKEEDGKLKYPIVNVETQFGEGNGWILVVEAYVEGVMNVERPNNF